MKYLKISSLEKGWTEYDELMIHAAFQCLVDFMGKDNPDVIDWNYDKGHKKALVEMQKLYNWWTKERPEREKDIDLSMSEKSDEEDQKNFHRLLELSNSFDRVLGKIPSKFHSAAKEAYKKLQEEE